MRRADAAEDMRSTAAKPAQATKEVRCGVGAATLAALGEPVALNDVSKESKTIV